MTTRRHLLGVVAAGLLAPASMITTAAPVTSIAFKPLKLGKKEVVYEIKDDEFKQMRLTAMLMVGALAYVRDDGTDIESQLAALEEVYRKKLNYPKVIH